MNLLRSPVILAVLRGLRVAASLYGCTERGAVHPEHGTTFTDAENMGTFPVAEPGDGTQMN